MYRFFENESNLKDDRIVMSEENSHHMKVLRIEENEKYEIVINGMVYVSKILEKYDEIFVSEILSKKEDDNESNININLYQGLPKQDKFEWIIQKTTELGISKIIPFESSRTIVKWDEKKQAKKLSRYTDIAKSASKQSKRSLIPMISECKRFNEVIEELSGKTTLVAYENNGLTLKEVLQEFRDLKKIEINIVIGAEGGFSSDEIAKFESINAKIVNLGNRILRTETASIALTAMIQYELGDINK